MLIEFMHHTAPKLSKQLDKHERLKVLFFHFSCSSPHGHKTRDKGYLFLKRFTQELCPKLCYVDLLLILYSLYFPLQEIKNI